MNIEQEVLMKRSSLLLRTFLVLGYTLMPAEAQETKAAKIEELLKVSGAEAMSQQVYGQMRAMVGTQLNAVGGSEEAKAAAAQMIDKVMAQLQERLSWARMKPEYVRLYDEVYSDQEITGILEFYKSAVGQAFLKKTPVLVSKSMEMVQRQMADFMPELQRMTKEAKQGKSEGQKK
jgi:hypothetical protein